MNKPISLSERIERYLTACPPAISGQGGHDQTFTVACALVNGFALDQHQALGFLQQYNLKCNPPWIQAELEHKISSALATEHDRARGHLIDHQARGQCYSSEPQPAKAKQVSAPTLQPHRASSKWPQPRMLQIQKIVNAGGGLADLVERSPLRFDDDEPHTEEIVDILFPGNPLLCVGKSQSVFATRRRETFRGRLAEMAFMAPNPMLAIQGRTKEGKQSEHALQTTGRQVYQVTEFDFSLVNRAGNTPSCWAPLVRAWQARGITIADACAALMLHLASLLPLVLAVHSGGKSIHGWYRVFELSFKERFEFMHYAVSLGADHATWCRSQFVRIPDGLRDNGKRQLTYFFNPQEAIQL